MLSIRILWFAVLAGSSFAANVSIPGGALTVPGTSASGASFTYTGTLTQNDTITFVQASTGTANDPCLQTTNGYCVNGAGVLTVAATVGSTPVGGSSSFSGPSGIIPAGTWTYGALLMIISGVGTVQVFPTNAGNGLGSSSPPTSLTLGTTTLSALGFPAFSQVNPTITFIVADTFFGDNGGQFVLTQGAAAPPPVPAPSTWLLLLIGLGVTGLLMRRRLFAN